MRIATFTQSNGKEALDLRDLTPAELACIRQFVVHLEYAIDQAREDPLVKKIHLSSTMDVEESSR